MLAEKLELAREQAELADLTRNLISNTQQQQPDQDAGSAPADESHQPQSPSRESPQPD